MASSQRAKRGAPAGGRGKPESPELPESPKLSIAYDELPAQRLRQALGMQGLGRQLQRQRLLRLAREAGEPTDDATIDAKLYAWLLHRPGERSDAERLAALRARLGP